jgi:hypothetical protein
MILPFNQVKLSLSSPYSQQNRSNRALPNWGIIDPHKGSISFSHESFIPKHAVLNECNIILNNHAFIKPFQVMQFLLRQKHTKKYILVHCTHGHNRTGYMIVHYLMRSQPMSVTQVSFQCFLSCVSQLVLFRKLYVLKPPLLIVQAIKIFAEARPPGIYKPDYIDALYSFYHERKPEMAVCPPTPEWKRSSEFDLNGEAVPDDDDDGGSAKNLHVCKFFDLTSS